jgi:hypothetical protein
MTAGHWGAATLTAGIAGIVAKAHDKARDAVQSLAFKTMLALTAAPLPALAVAAFLGSTLITAVGDAEADFDKATLAARRINDIRVLIEKESRLIARIPAELDLRRLHQYAEVQGYLFSKPILADEVRLLLQPLAPRSKAVA